MPHLFDQRDIQMITGDLKLFLNAGKEPIGKLDYFINLQSQPEEPGGVKLEYRYEYIDIIPEVENAVIRQITLAEKRETGIQLHLSPASFLLCADRLFLQQILFRLLVSMLESNETKSIVSVYVSDSDGKCIIEAVAQAEAVPQSDKDTYFKKYRITNVLETAQKHPSAVLAVYKKMVEDMGGELAYSFEINGNHYFRLKFMLT